MATAFRNPDGSIAIAVFNLGEADLSYQLTIPGKTFSLGIPGQALQTLLLHN